MGDSWEMRRVPSSSAEVIEFVATIHGYKVSVSCRVVATVNNEGRWDKQWRASWVGKAGQDNSDQLRNARGRNWAEINQTVIAEMKAKGDIS